MSLPESIEISVKLRLTIDPSRAKNSLHLTIADTCAQVFNGDRHIGRVAGCIGGAIEVSIDQPGGLPIAYTLNPLHLFEAVAGSIRPLSD